MAVNSNTSRPRQNGHHYADHRFNCIFLNANLLIWIAKDRWSLFLIIQFTIFQHWLRWWLGADQETSHYLKQWWLDCRQQRFQNIGIYTRVYTSMLWTNSLCNICIVWAMSDTVAPAAFIPMTCHRWLMVLFPMTKSSWPVTKSWFWDGRSCVGFNSIVQRL